MKIVLASKNPGKLKEFAELAKEAQDLELVLAPDSFDPAETGATFVENAVIKAQAAAALTGLHALADDSGLAVDALDGAPGIHSARYCEGTDADRRRKLLSELLHKPGCQRTAAFKCAIVFCAPDGEVLHTTQASWHGEIATEEKGSNGFGYDPIFNVAGTDRTSAQMSSEEKNLVSHRAQAWRLMMHYFSKER